MKASGGKSNLTGRHGVNFASPAKARNGMLNSFAKKWTGEDYDTPRSIGNNGQAGAELGCEKPSHRAALKK